MNKKFLTDQLSLFAKKAFSFLIVGSFTFSLHSCSLLPVSQTKMVSEKTATNQNTNKLKFDLKISFDNPFSVKAAPRVPKKIEEIKSYQVFLCTDPNAPFTSKVNTAGGADINLDRDGASLNVAGFHSLTFNDVPAGNTYYAVVSAYDQVGGGGNNITAEQFYPGDNTFHQMAVSTNGIQVNNDFTLNIIGNNFLAVNLELEAASPGDNDFQVDGGGVSNQENPSLATNNLGNGLIVYSDTRDFGATGRGIYARSLLNFVPFGQELLFSDAAIGSMKIEPEININSSGDGLIVWHDFRDGANANIYAHKVVNYQPSGSDFLVSSDNASMKTNPHISLNVSGDGVVVWEDQRNGSSTPNIYLRKIVNFSPVDSDIQLDSSLASFSQLNPRIGTIDANGNSLVVWQNKGASGNFGIYLKKITAFAPDQALPTQVDSDSGDTTSQKVPALQTNDQGNGLIVWVDGRNFDSLHYRAIVNYTPIGSDELLEAPTGLALPTSYPPSIALNNVGDGLVVFSSDQISGVFNIWGIKIERFRRTGNTKLITDISPSGTQSVPLVTINNRGNGIVAWQRNSDIYAHHLIEFEPY